MNKHTPGPWAVSQSDPTVVVALDRGRYSVTVAETVGYKDPREANARLIAAAPELLAALEGIMAGIAGCQKDEHYDAARSAIAKATGDLAGMWNAIPADERDELTRAFAAGMSEQAKGEPT